MQRIPKEEVLRRIRFENPWWEEPHQVESFYRDMPRRAYFDLFAPLVRQTAVRRAVVLMGPRRVGKTVILHQLIHHLLTSGVKPSRICYLSVDHPIYNGLGLDEMFADYLEASQVEGDGDLYVFFDEIQYLPGWEVHLKALVDSYRSVQFAVSGSAAAALRLKSIESGAGRFTDFLLPPLTFHEYLNLLEIDGLMEVIPDGVECQDIDTLNRHFLNYVNYGGYPEVIFSRQIQENPGRYIRHDIIDKVLLRDLPSLYGIQEIQELNSLFTTLAYNTAGEVSLEGLSKGSGVAKNTIKKYIEYLEAAFLLKVVHRIDRNARRFKRANFFKVYLTNPSMRSALFSPIQATDDAMGRMAETAIFSQWFHGDIAGKLYYARWTKGEVDIVHLQQDGKPAWAVEVKWSNKIARNPADLDTLLRCPIVKRLGELTVTTRSTYRTTVRGDIELEFVPASVYCYMLGSNIIAGKSPRFITRSDKPE